MEIGLPICVLCHLAKSKGGPRHKRPCELSDEEVFLLMQAFTQGKTLVTEEDCLTLCRWAQAQKLGAYVLQLVLAGHLRIEVEEGVVKVGLRGDGPLSGR